MNKLCCLINGTVACADCKKTMCLKHSPNPTSHYGYRHKVERCLQCHRKFVIKHRTGEVKTVSREEWMAQIYRRWKKQGKKIPARPPRYYYY